MKRVPRKLVTWLSVALMLTSFAAKCRGEPPLVGPASCATAMCHGGIPGRGPAWNSSLNVWKSQDRHALAGLALLGTASQAIIGCLQPELATGNPPLADPESIGYRQVLRQRCIGCHTAAHTPEPSDLIESHLITAGVSCAACHGPAADWLVSHRYASWSQKSAAEKLASGMRDTEHWVTRVAGCVRCHIGSRTADGMIRDVDHELIAAGHPALRFDAWLFMANLQPHWNVAAPPTRDERQAGRQLPQFEAGRLLSLAASADLERERDEGRFMAGANPQSKSPSVAWPDLAQYDCFACHHDLRTPRSRATSGPAVSWNPWYLAGLSPTLASQPLLRLAALNDAEAAARRTLLERLSRTARNDARVALQSKNARPWQSLLNAVQEGETIRDWHDASFWYLRLLAAVADTDGTPQVPVELIVSVRKALDDLAQGPLKFGEGWNSPRNFTWEEYDRIYQQIRTVVGHETIQQ